MDNRTNAGDPGGLLAGKDRELVLDPSCYAIWAYSSAGRTSGSRSKVAGKHYSQAVPDWIRGRCVLEWGSGLGRLGSGLQAGSS